MPNDEGHLVLPDHKSEINVDELYQCITKELAELLGHDELKDLLKDFAKTGHLIPIYWGTAPTGFPSIGYFEPMRVIARLIRLGCFRFTILFADKHALIETGMSKEVISARTEVYKIVIIEMLKYLGLTEKEIKDIRFVVGSSFQTTPDYIDDLFLLGSKTTENRAKHASSEVVKADNDPCITKLFYTPMQALDEKYLGVKVQLGGVDQRKIMSYSREFMPMMGRPKCVQLMNKLVSGISPVSLNGQQLKMSSSDKSTKLTVIDTDIKKKINKAYCLEKDITDNTPLSFLTDLLFPVIKIKDPQATFVINRPEKWGGRLEYKEAKDVITEFQSGALHPADLKMGISDLLNQMTTPFRDKLIGNELLVQAKYV